MRQEVQHNNIYDKIPHETLYQGNINQSVYGQYKTATKYLVKARIEADNNRTEFLKNRLNDVTLENDQQTRTAIGAIMEVEQKQQCYQTMQEIKNPSTFNGRISYILVLNETKHRHVQDPQEMNKILLKQNQKHFS